MKAAGVGRPAELERLIRLWAERHLPGEESGRVIAAAGALAELLAFLIAENETTNFISAKAAEPEELVSRHLGDSLLGLALLPPAPAKPGRLLDVGSGGGFPALPLLVVRRDLDGTLVESTRKKCVFLEAACRRLALTAEVVNARFPDSFAMKNRARYDILTTRAVASAGRLVHAALPVLAPAARALLWTTEPLFRELVRESGATKARFVPDPGAAARGIAVLESFT